MFVFVLKSSCVNYWGHTTILFAVIVLSTHTTKSKRVAMTHPDEGMEGTCPLAPVFGWCGNGGFSWPLPPPSHSQTAVTREHTVHGQCDRLCNGEENSNAGGGSSLHGRTGTALGRCRAQRARTHVNFQPCRAEIATGGKPEGRIVFGQIPIDWSRATRTLSYQQRP